MRGEQARPGLRDAVGRRSFDFRTETEAAWDFLEFRVNGLLLERWSG
jgi:hypothetical protein